jgi:hypothetical protein
MFKDSQAFSSFAVKDLDAVRADTRDGGCPGEASEPIESHAGGVLAFLAASLFTVEQQSVAIVQRLGRFVREAGPGIED